MGTDAKAPGSQRARRAAGWRWLKILAPPDLYGHVGTVVNEYRLSREEVMRTALARGLETIRRQEWYARKDAVRLRLPRRDAGLSRECRARKQAEQEAAGGGGSGPNTPEV